MITVHQDLKTNEVVIACGKVMLALDAENAIKLAHAIIREAKLLMGWLDA